MKCLLLEGIHPIAEKSLKAKGLLVESVKYAPNTEELIQNKTSQVLGVRSATRLTKEVFLNLSPNLTVVGAFCVGADQIDLKAGALSGVPVFNAPYGNTRSVAELVISHIIALSRQSYGFNQDMHQQKWKKSAKNSHEVRGRTLGIVGYGHIGSQVSVLAEAIGMKTLYFDIINTLNLGNARPQETLKELLSLSDFVTLHVPQTPKTYNMIGKQQLSWMKKGSYLINTSRGQVVVLEDLAQALKTGHIAGAGLDVFPEEPRKKQSPFTCPLQGLRQVILTPHIAGSTEEAQQNIARQVSTSVMKYIFQGVSEGALNFPTLNPPPLTDNKKCQRLTNIHKNIPGVLADINGLVSKLKINIQSQYLATNAELGYLIMDLEYDKVQKLKLAINSLSSSIKTRILPA